MKILKFSALNIRRIMPVFIAVFFTTILAAHFCWIQSALAAPKGKKKIVIHTISGPNSGAARQGVARSLKAKTIQLNDKTFIATGGELGVSTTNEDGIPAICAKIKCDAVIIGTVSKNKRLYMVTLNVLDGGTGKSLGRVGASGRGPVSVARSAAKAGARCAPLLARAKAPQSTSDADAALAAPSPAAAAIPLPGETSSTPKAAATPAPANKAAAEPPPSENVPSFKPKAQSAVHEDETTEKETKIKSKKRRRALEAESEDELDEEMLNTTEGLFDLAVALGLCTRNYKLSGSNAAQDSNYDGGMFPEITLRASLYPAVPFTDAFFRNVGLGVSYARHLSISTKTQQATAPKVDTSSSEFILDAKLRWKFTTSNSSPVLLGFAGFGMRNFELGQNLVLTSFSYRFLRLGGEIFLPFGTPLFGLIAGGEVRPLIGVGQQAVNSYGQASGVGYSFHGGLQGIFKRLGLFYFIDAQYLTFSMDFKGLAQEFNPDPGYPSRREATTGQDKYFRLMVGGGYEMK